MTAVATHCKSHKHHPEWTNIYNKTHIKWTTHNPSGLSAKDTALARVCDDIAREMGEVVPEPETESKSEAEPRSEAGVSSEASSDGLNEDAEKKT